MAILRRLLVLILAPAMWLCSSTPFLFDLGRGPAALSDKYDTLLVPYGIAFSIWLPIFVGCMAYGIVQILPRNYKRAIFDDISGWTIGGFAGVCAWGLAAAFAPLEQAALITALIFVPTVLLLCRVAVITTRRRHELTELEGYLVWLPLSFLAGWTSLAVFLNWAQLGVHGPLGLGLPVVIICLLSLAAALAWVSFMLHHVRGSAAYLFPVVWGLAWLVFARLAGEPKSLTIAIAAIFGALLLMFTGIYLRREVEPAKL